MSIENKSLSHFSGIRFLLIAAGFLVATHCLTPAPAQAGVLEDYIEEAIRLQQQIDDLMGSLVGPGPIIVLICPPPQELCEIPSNPCTGSEPSVACMGVHECFVLQQDKLACNERRYLQEEF